MALETELATFREFVRERGLRMTAERLALFHEIFSRHEHVDADRLADEMRARGVKISRATVYRNLELLAECGLVRKYQLDPRRYLYEHIHAGQTHDHLICRECGRVVEFMSPAAHGELAELCRAHGFDPDEIQIQLEGLCLPCRNARAAAQSG